MILAHKRLPSSRRFCTLSVAEKNIFVSTVDDISIPTAEVLLESLCSLIDR